MIDTTCLKVANHPIRCPDINLILSAAIPSFQPNNIEGLIHVSRIHCAAVVIVAMLE